MAKTFKELLVAAQYSDEEVEKVLVDIGVAALGLTIKRISEKLPPEKTEDFHLYEEKERVELIFTLAHEHLTKDIVIQIQEEARQELVNAFTKEHIVPRITKE